MAAFEEPIPQKSLDAIRSLLEGLDRGLDGEELEVASGLKSRALGYALSAARTLSLVERTTTALTSRGRAVLKHPRWSNGERDAFRAALVHSELFRVVVPDLLDQREPPRDELAGRIARLSGLSLSTAGRRVPDLLGWRNRILGVAKGSQLRLVSSARGLSSAAIDTLKRTNPWWTNDAMRPVMPVRRAFVSVAQRRLGQAAAPIVVIKGPRQVGKSIAQEQMIADLLSSGVAPDRILRVQFDDLPALRGLSQQPILDLVAWFEKNVLKTTLNGAARQGRSVFVFVDEAQNVPDWSVQLKSLVDLSEVKVVLTGSSALKIQKNADSLAGRTTTIEVSTLSLAEIARFRGMGHLETLLDNGPGPLKSSETWRRLVALGEQQQTLRDQAFELFLERGGYPRCHVDGDATWVEISPGLRADVIEKAIGHDARVGASGRGRKRRTDLLEGVFRLACRHAGRQVKVQTIARLLSAEGLSDVTPQLVQDYLSWYEGALLLRQVRPIEARKRAQSGASKLCLVDHGLRQAYLADDLPLSPGKLEHADQSISAEVGDVIESIVGAWLGRIANTTLAWFPTRENEPEVDFVLTVGDQRIPVEVKYRRRVHSGDADGLRAFMRAPGNRAPFGILVTQGTADIGDEHIVVVPLASLLLLAP